MFDAYYAAMLTLWTALARYASIGQLADGSAMPIEMRTQIAMRAPIVQALVRRGRALSGTDISGNATVVAQLLQQQIAFQNIASRFGVLSAVSLVTTPAWQAGERLGQQIGVADPELAQVLHNAVGNVPDLAIGGGIGLAVGLGLGAIGLVLVLKATR